MLPNSMKIGFVRAHCWAYKIYFKIISRSFNKRGQIKIIKNEIPFDIKTHFESYFERNSSSVYKNVKNLKRCSQKSIEQKPFPKAVRFVGFESFFFWFIRILSKSILKINVNQKKFEVVNQWLSPCLIRSLSSISCGRQICKRHDLSCVSPKPLGSITNFFDKYSLS